MPLAFSYPDGRLLIRQIMEFAVTDTLLMWLLIEDGLTTGPFPDEQIVARLATGDLRPEVLACRQGQNTWNPLSRWPEFSELVSASEHPDPSKSSIEPIPSYSHPPEPQDTSVPMSEEPLLGVTQCPNCGIRVLPMQGNVCPSCRQTINWQNEEMTRDEAPSSSDSQTSREQSAKSTKPRSTERAAASTKLAKQPSKLEQFLYLAAFAIFIIGGYLAIQLIFFAFPGLSQWMKDHREIVQAIRIINLFASRGHHE
jgi:hypothetical protein